MTNNNLIIALLIIATPMLAYAAWEVGRYLNYSLSYEEQVQATVCEMVKPEYLIKKCIKP